MTLQTLTADAAIAAALTAARQGGPLVDADACRIDDAEQAYRIHALVLNHLQTENAGGLQHWKSGGASRHVQLTHSQLPSTGVWASPAQAQKWPFRIRGVEAEIALRLNTAVDAAMAERLTPSACTQLVSDMAVSIELVDSRWQQGFEVPALHKLADHQLHGALVLGEWQPYTHRDWVHQRGDVRIDQNVVSFSGTHSLSDPAWVLTEWLRHATRYNGVVPAGSVVTTGTWCGLLLAKPGDEVVARFEGLGDARVQL